MTAHGIEILEQSHIFTAFAHYFLLVLKQKYIIGSICNTHQTTKVLDALEFYTLSASAVFCQFYWAQLCTNIQRAHNKCFLDAGHRTKTKKNISEI